MPRLDHENHNTLDYRRNNLRLATYQQNGANRRKEPGTSRFKGVRRARGKWVARIMKGGTRLFLGSYDSEEEAGRRYATEAAALHKEFAHAPGIEFVSESEERVEIRVVKK